MSYYVTMNLEIEYKTDEEYKGAVSEAQELGWFSKTDEEGHSFLLDECDDIASENIFNDKAKTIRINNIYIRNGYKLLSILETNAMVNGRVTSTDGTFELTTITDNVPSSKDMDEFLKENDLILPDSNYDYDNEDESDEYNKKMDAIFEEMDWWCSDF